MHAFCDASRMLDPADANFQRILWRDSRDSRIAEFRITRVCFGLASSPFLATRALNQLAMEHEASHPLASETLRTAFYVDDCVISVETKEQALETQLQLVEVLEKGGFSLAKWASNDPELIPEESSTDSKAEVPDVISALGMRWNTKSDVFEFICPISKNDTCITKRDVASLIARLFDPLGLIGPVVVEAKMLLQDLHEAKLKWDTPISPEHSVKWTTFNEIVAEHIKLFTAMPSVTSNSPNAIHQISARFSKTIMALDAMSVTQRDPWLIYFVLEKLDSESRVLWGRECGADVPTIEHFKKFLNQRCIDNLNANEKSKGSSSTPSKPQPSKPSTKKSNVTALNTTVVSAKCNCCQETNHPLYKCPKFLSQTPAERLETVKTLKLCKNCFAHHYTSSCTFRKCRKCHSKHNVLLHDSSVNSPANPTPSTSRSDTSANSDTRDTPPSTDTNPSPSVVAISSTIGSDLSGQPPKVFLATAMTYILTANNEKLPCRVILDGGAQINVMTTSLYQKLNLPKQSVGFNVSGVNDRRSAIKYSTEATIISPTSGVTFTLTCCLLPKIASNIPNWKVDEDAIGIPPGVVLADPDWAKQKPVDLLVCGNAYWESWLADTISLGPGLPVLKETVFGYVVVGEHTTSTSQQTPFYNNLTVSAIEDSAKLDESIKRFWELEDLPKDSTPTIDEHVEAEKHFVNTHKRAPDGRFIVRLPFKKDPSTLGYSRQRAMQQFMALERKFDKNPLLQSMYSDVIHDYLKRGWLEPVPVHSLRDPSYYMPHHGVMKEASTTTKLRIVNNGSAKTSSGLSLNDILMTGPTVQPDLASILLRFRQHPYALTADISKMYLQFHRRSCCRN
uniref:Uncharacterized protein n=1 Tax=Phlebotomus papatasi TaxID=29031 RepID=A0A1B0DKT8_PHLPP